MDNILVFIASTVVYCAIFLAVEVYRYERPGAPPSFNLKKAGIIALLCLPVNINGTVVTAIGSVASSTDSYAVFAPIQVADNDAVSLFGSFYRKTGGSAYTIVGLSGYQKVGRNAGMFTGLSGYTEAGNEAFVSIGLSVYQKAKRAGVLFGLSGYQKADQEAGVGFGVAGYQESNNGTLIAIGLAGYQKAEKDAISGLGMTLVQQVGNQSRAFAVFSELKAPEDKKLEPDQKKPN